MTKIVKTQNKQGYINYLIEILHNESNGDFENWSELIKGLSNFPLDDWHEELKCQDEKWFTEEQLISKMALASDEEFGIDQEDYPVLLLTIFEKDEDRNGHLEIRVIDSLPMSQLESY